MSKQEIRRSGADLNIQPLRKSTDVFQPSKWVVRRADGRSILHERDVSGKVTETLLPADKPKFIVT